MNMSDDNSEKPRYVTCRCRNCDKGIEFDANQSTAENNLVSCPHCGLETMLFVPQSANESKPPILNPPVNLPQEPATPRQVAYLNYMGVQNADHLTKQQTYDLIQSGSVLGESKNVTDSEKLQARQDYWHKQRLIQHPDLYPRELNEFFEKELPESLHAYVRNRVVGSSDLLTKPIIQDVIFKLNEENPEWWRKAGYQSIFFDRLKQIYPRCCDGHAPKRLNKSRRFIYPLPQSSANKSGCLVLLSAMFLFVICCIILFM